jgi:hypothetical protein
MAMGKITRRLSESAHLLRCHPKPYVDYSESSRMALPILASITSPSFKTADTSLGPRSVLLYLSASNDVLT